MLSRQVMANITRSSTQPPRNPPSTPRVTPITPLASAATVPITSEIRAPYTSRAR